MIRRKVLSLANLSLFESETIFSRKIISEKKKIIVMDLCPATFRSLVVQWSAKIVGRRPQLKHLQGFQYTSVTQRFEYARICLGRVLNISYVLNMPGF